MGYTVEFEGSFDITPKLDEETYRKLKNLIDEEEMSYEIDYSTITLPYSQNYHSYETDLQKLIEKVLAPNGYELNGEISFREEENVLDSGIITIENNRMQIEGYMYEKGNTWFPVSVKSTSEEKINLLSRESPDISTSSSSNQVNLGVSKIYEVIQSTTLSASEIASIILFLNKKLPITSNLEKT